MQSEIKDKIWRLLNLKIDQDKKDVCWGNCKDLFTLNVSYCSCLLPGFDWNNLHTMSKKEIQSYLKGADIYHSVFMRFSLVERVRAHLSMPVREVSPLKFNFLHIEVLYPHVKINKSRWNACIQHESTDANVNTPSFQGHTGDRGNSSANVSRTLDMKWKWNMLLKWNFSFLCLSSISNFHYQIKCMLQVCLLCLFFDEPNVFAKAKVWFFTLLCRAVHLFTEVLLPLWSNLCHQCGRFMESLNESVICSKAFRGN